MITESLRRSRFIKLDEIPPLMAAPALSVIVPTFNEAGCNEQFLDRVGECLESLGLAWEIVLVDDGSTDGTVALIERRMTAADSDERMARCLRRRPPPHGRSHARQGCGRMIA